MNNLVEQVLGEKKEKDGYETRTYTINAHKDHLDLLEQFFRWINSTRSGHSGSAKLFVDGDGRARVTIEKKGGELATSEKDFKTHKSDGPEFAVGLD